MAGNAAKFALEIDRDLELAEDELRLVVQSLALQGLRGIVLRTAVDEGRARGNWSVTIGTRDMSQKEVNDKSGGPTIAAGEAVIDSYATREGFPSIIIQNNLPYIVRLENGYSKRFPDGMVAVTLAELRAQLS